MDLDVEKITTVASVTADVSLSISLFRQIQIVLSWMFLKHRWRSLTRCVPLNLPVLIDESSRSNSINLPLRHLTFEMTSATISTKGLIGHPTFSRSIESHGSAHSADTNYNGWRGEGMSGNEDMGTQTDYNPGTGNVSSSSGRALLGELKRRREDAILDISLESMKYNGGTKDVTVDARVIVEREEKAESSLTKKRSRSTNDRVSVSRDRKQVFFSNVPPSDGLFTNWRGRI